MPAQTMCWVGWSIYCYTPVCIQNRRQANTRYWYKILVPGILFVHVTDHQIVSYVLLFYSVTGIIAYQVQSKAQRVKFAHNTHKIKAAATTTSSNRTATLGEGSSTP